MIRLTLGLAVLALVLWQIGRRLVDPDDAPRVSDRWVRFNLYERGKQGSDV